MNEYDLFFGVFPCFAYSWNSIGKYRLQIYIYIYIYIISHIIYIYMYEIRQNPHLWTPRLSEASHGEVLLDDALQKVKSVKLCERSSSFQPWSPKFAKLNYWKWFIEKSASARIVWYWEGHPSVVTCCNKQWPAWSAQGGDNKTASTCSFDPHTEYSQYRLSYVMWYMVISAHECWIEASIGREVDMENEHAKHAQQAS